MRAPSWLPCSIAFAHSTNTEHINSRNAHSHTVSLLYMLRKSIEHDFYYANSRERRLLTYLVAQFVPF